MGQQPGKRFEIDDTLEPWLFPSTGEIIQPTATLIVGPNMVSVENIYSKVFDLEHHGYDADDVEKWTAKERDDMEASGLDARPGGQRREITDFTRASQHRFQKACSLWVPVGQMVFVTLTYGASWPGPDDRRRQFKRFCDAMREDHGDLAGCWKLEYQRRGAPHYHLVLQTGQRHPNLPMLNKIVNVLWCKIVGANVRTAVEFPRNEARAKYYLTKEVGKMVQASKSERAKCDTVVDHAGRFWGWFNRSQLQFQGDFYTMPSDVALLVREAIQGLVLEGMAKDKVVRYDEDGKARLRDGREVQPDLLPAWRIFDSGALAFEHIRQRVLEKHDVDVMDHMSRFHPPPSQ